MTINVIVLETELKLNIWKWCLTCNVGGWCLEQLCLPFELISLSKTGANADQSNLKGPQKIRGSDPISDTRF